MKNGKFQSDYQASLRRSWTPDTGASFPGSHTEARQAPEGVHAGRLAAPRLGFSLPVLTKGGSSVEEMGVDFQGRKGEVERMAPLRVLIIPKEFREHRPGQGGERAKSREPAWIPLGSQRKAVWFLRQEALSLLVLIPLMSLSTFFPISHLVCLLTFPGGVLQGMGEWVGMGKSNWHSL